MEIDANIFFPRIDDHNGNSGIIGMEFPVLNYLHFLMAKFFGYQHWYGRLVNLIISTLGLIFYYRLILQANINKRIAFYSTVFLSVSIWFSFSRKMMPDTFCISLVMISLYYGLCYLEEFKRHQICLFSIFGCLAILTKIPAVLYLVFLLPKILEKRQELKEKKIFIFCFCIILILNYLWYFHWNFYLHKTYGNWYNSGKPFLTGLKETILKFNLVINNFSYNAFSGYTFFILFLIGCFAIIKFKEKKIGLIFLLSSISFGIYILKSGWFFYHHSYYIIPFVPIMALIAGYGFSKIHFRPIWILILTYGVFESLISQKSDFDIPPSERYRISLEGIMDRISRKDDLILINGNGNPQMMYLAHRRGWNCVDWQVTELRHIQKIVTRQCKFVVINKHNNDELKGIKLPLEMVFENQDFTIFNTENLFDGK